MSSAGVLAPRPVSVRFEHHADGRLGIGESRPRLSWHYDTAPEGFRQSGAVIEVTVDIPGRDSEVTEYLVDGDEQVLVSWPGRTLTSR